MKSPKRSSRGLHLVPLPAAADKSAVVHQPAEIQEPAALPEPDWKTAASGWSACVLLLCICGWTADMNDAQIASCSNPRCSCRARAYTVHVTVTEIECKGTI